MVSPSSRISELRDLGLVVYIEKKGLSDTGCPCRYVWCVPGALWAIKHGKGSEEWARYLHKMRRARKLRRRAREAGNEGLQYLEKYHRRIGKSYERHHQS